MTRNLATKEDLTELDFGGVHPETIARWQRLERVADAARAFASQEFKCVDAGGLQALWDALEALDAPQDPKKL